MARIVTMLMACLACIARLHAQTPADASYLLKSGDMNINLEDGKFVITEDFNSEKSFVQNFDRYTHESVVYSDFDPITYFSAETLVPGRKSNYKKVPVYAIETKDMVMPGVFYGGYKEKDFVYPAVTEGAIGKLSVTKQVKDVHLLDPFYFDDDLSVKESRFSVSFPSSVKLEYRLFGLEKDQIEFTEEYLGARTRYSWSMKDVPAYQYTEDSPGRLYESPHVVVFIGSYQLNGKEQKVLSDPSDLYHWYSGLLSKVPTDVDNKTLNTKVAALTDSLSTDDDKMRSIFQWVQQNIRYVAFEDGMAGFIPRAPADVFTKRYGDCKDMANLLRYMLTQAGFKAHCTWIGTRSKPYRHEDLPTTVTDNHMICSVEKKDGTLLFLDATDPYVEFGMPTSMIQGKEALLGIDTAHFKLVTVPVQDRLMSQANDTISVWLDKNGLRGTFSGVLTGYRRDDLQADRFVAEVQNDKEYVRDFFQVGDNNILIDSVIYSDLDSRQAAMRVRFNFFQPGSYNLVGNKLYINLNLNKKLPGVYVDVATRKEMVEQDYRFDDKLTVKFSLPAGYAISFMPAESSKAGDSFGVEARYSLQGNALVLQREIYCNKLYIDPAGFEGWNNFLHDLTAVFSQTVALSKPN